jgi:DNA-binding response OmpR family regulator
MSDRSMGQLRALILEDDLEIQNVLKELLEEEGYSCTVEGSAFGSAGLVRELQPDVILLDLALPYRSGVSLLAEIKADSRTVRIPVIIVSAIGDALRTEQRALAAAVIPKPFDAEALRDAVTATRKSAL